MEEFFFGLLFGVVFTLLATVIRVRSLQFERDLAINDMTRSIMDEQLLIEQNHKQESIIQQLRFEKQDLCESLESYRDSSEDWKGGRQ